MEISIDVQFVCEYEGIKVYSVRCGDIVRLIRVKAADAEELEKLGEEDL